MIAQEEEIELFKIGDILYRVGKEDISQITIMDIKHYPHCVYKDDYGRSYYNHTIRKSCFKTLEEAKQEVQRRENIAKKRKYLKEYELQLNEQLNIQNHFIVK